MADENKQIYPEAARIIDKDMYVDDLLTGDDDAETLKKNCILVSSLLASASFKLRKWNFNSIELCNNFDLSHEDCPYAFSSAETKTLGVLFDKILIHFVLNQICQIRQPNLQKEPLSAKPHNYSTL